MAPIPWKQCTHNLYLDRIRKVSQKLIPLYNGFMALLCHYLREVGCFLWFNSSVIGLLHNKSMTHNNQKKILNATTAQKTRASVVQRLTPNVELDV